MEWYTWLILVVIGIVIVRGVYSFFSQTGDGGSNDNDNDD